MRQPHFSDIAVTAREFEVLSTTERSTDGTASHWKYIIGNAIVYRDAYLLEGWNQVDMGSLRIYV